MGLVFLLSGRHSLHNGIHVRSWMGRLRFCQRSNKAKQPSQRCESQYHLSPPKIVFFPD
jgi:hypothetical protein